MNVNRAIFSMGQTTQVQSGGTPAVDRYGLWFIALIIPLLANAVKLNAPQLARYLLPVAFISIGLSFYTYAPQRPEQYLHPSRIATWVWAHEPSLDNPLPAVFYERESHLEELPVPIGTPTCSKILLVDGRAPAACPVEDKIPKECHYSATALCYANRDGTKYQFVVWKGATGF